MIIVSSDKKKIINSDNIKEIKIDRGNATLIVADGRFLEQYESEEVTQTVFEQIIEALEQCEEIFYMPE